MIRWLAEHPMAYTVLMRSYITLVVLLTVAYYGGENWTR